VSWRWCFWINLPAGAVVLTALYFAFQPPKTQLRKVNRDWKQAVQRLDPFGTISFIAGVTCCLLAIQWGGSKYPWKDGRIIALFILSWVLVTAFGFIETKMGDDALVPVHIINRRSILASAFFVTCLGGVMYTYVYFFPIWFQAIKGVTAWQSGVMLIPFLLGVIIMSIIAGVGVTMIGYYAPPMIGTSIIMSIGAGLSTTLAVNSGHAEWIGYQVLLGLGIGMGLQQPLICIQAVLPIEDVPIGTGVIMFMRRSPQYFIHSPCSPGISRRLLGPCPSLERFEFRAYSECRRTPC
jgi:MFS family permease